MTASYKTVKTRVGKFVRDDDLSFIDTDVLIEAATAVYSRHRPYVTLGDISGAGSALLSLPAAWVQDFSVIRRVVYPYEDHDSDALKLGTYEIYRDLVSSVPTDKLRLVNYTAGSGETVRVWFTALHTFTEAGEAASTNTVPDGDVQALTFLACAFICRARASYFVSLKSQAVTADLVDFGDKAAQATAQAEAFWQLYCETIGMDPDKPRAIAAAGDVDTTTQHGMGFMQAHHWPSRR